MPLAVKAKYRSVGRAVAAGRERSAAPSHRYQNKRKSNSEYRGHDHRKADPRIRNGDSDSHGNHPQPAHTLDLNVCHVDQRG